MAAGTDLGIEGLSQYKEIGYGGFSTVYSAIDSAFGRTVAVKVLTRIDEAGQRRFDRERLSMGRLQAHPNVVTPFGSGYTMPERRPYLVMEHLPGGSLQELIDAHGPVAWQPAIDVLLPIASALGYGHSVGVLHRDVKPANILRTGSGVVKLSDFGIAAIRDVTATTMTAFSIAHAPPETFARGKDLRDERSDLYSLASTLYAMVTGRGPFERAGDESQLAQLNRIADEPVPPTGISGTLDHFFALALSKRPEDRYQSTTKFISALTMVRRGEAPSSPDPAVAQPIAVKTTKPGGPPTGPVASPFSAVSEASTNEPATETRLPLRHQVEIVLKTLLGVTLVGLATFMTGFVVSLVANRLDSRAYLASAVPAGVGLLVLVQRLADLVQRRQHMADGNTEPFRTTTRQASRGNGVSELFDRTAGLALVVIVSYFGTVVNPLLGVLVLIWGIVMLAYRIAERRTR